MGYACRICCNFDAGIQVAITVFYSFNEILHVKVKSFSATFLQFNSFNKVLFVFFLRNDFPSIAVNNQSSVVSHKSNAMVSSVISTINTGSVVPEKCMPVEFVQGLQGIWSFSCIVWISKFSAHGHNLSLIHI